MNLRESIWPPVWTVSNGGETLEWIGKPKNQPKNSRVGATASIPLNKRQSFKFSYSAGAYIRFGGNYQNVSATWAVLVGSRTQIVEDLVA
jgi:hypothetical protein